MVLKKPLIILFRAVIQFISRRDVPDEIIQYGKMISE